jgi:hypothetical protein
MFGLLLGSVLKSWQTYVVLFLLGIIGTLWIQNASLSNTNDEQIKVIAELSVGLNLLEQTNINLIADIEVQNNAMRELMRQGVILETLNLTQGQIIADLLLVENRKITLIDSENVPKTCEGAMGWMLNKAIGEDFR